MPGLGGLFGAVKRGVRLGNRLGEFVRGVLGGEIAMAAVGGGLGVKFLIQRLLARGKIADHALQAFDQLNCFRCSQMATHSRS